ncbi:hypothetical protein CWB99_12950 [Pseudoalteromonas rubra]|uniref:Uncharacterized protein n=1 Tax=Pseudoalteromonas rubra TaxID=43658 RepID=A0A5S3WKV2_9GAMM|nr:MULTISPECIES: hypothetical protein [Pseudoalteromonas]MCO7188334.1 hypothetical protein [Pseudoalteromonas sp. XMcav2-N]TMP28017.1 hypothetical protein CWB99_12950 [Pseudoalteromonas rubra]TMP29237.1 hypothetical protein CWC00_19645 [Pseudoalteromonas rubra]
MQSRFWLLALCLMVSLTVNAAGNSASVKTAQLVELLSDPDEDKLDCDSDIPMPGSASQENVQPARNFPDSVRLYHPLTYYHQGIRAPPVSA